MDIPASDLKADMVIEEPVRGRVVSTQEVFGYIYFKVEGHPGPYRRLATETVTVADPSVPLLKRGRHTVRTARPEPPLPRQQDPGYVDHLERDRRTREVLEAVLEERRRQFARYGSNADLEDGTGPLTRWLMPLTNASALEVETMLRVDYEDYEEETGKPTWVHLIREEVAEAFKESDDARLEEELTQVAALAVSWIEKIRERNRK